MSTTTGVRHDAHASPDRLTPGRRRSPRSRRTRSWTRAAATAVALGSTFLAACASDDQPQSQPTIDDSTTAATAATATGTPDGTDAEYGTHPDHDQAMSATDRAAAQLATAGYQDVATAEAAGYASSLDTLGCFQDPALGGMGVHYIDQALMDATVDITEPEALVYELDADGDITGLVAHEYIVPVDAWSSATPPSLFGVSFHQHPTLPLWVLHAWLWKDNATGVFQDWNPAVRQCPPDVPIFGVDLPLPAATSPSAPGGG